MLAGLASKKGGMAPAMLLQALANARDSDGSTLQNSLRVREPERGHSVQHLALHQGLNLLVAELSGRELNWLLDGMDVFAMKPHGELSYETVL